MEVQNVYQDDQGKWHIDYDSTHLIGLAIRVYWGQFLLGLFIGIPLLILISQELIVKRQEVMVADQEARSITLRNRAYFVKLNHDENN